jgi:excisionase family DNA binding protein
MGTRGHITALPDTRQHATRLLSVDEAAARLHCSRRQVFRLLGDRVLPSVKVGRTRRVAASDVDAYLDRLRAT